ncbi:SDR family NAD(P)-dependent oxidoreductase, partial [bacterium]|nr:SDR family NAD(P)-dependent oxidoreductase [bacterium]
MVVVTGAGSGIGRALALCLGQRGARMVLVGRRQGVLAELAADIEAAGGRPAMMRAGDVGDWGQV